ncbi:MAG: T9SS type A sorting domain-containing protein [Crocinitomicaceae bacterium]|nr:T9SS type A sorting domain-containing protein [Crocinitomicaceae bacterium]
MKTTLLTFLALIPTILFSQITLTSADFATANDTVRISKATDNSIDFSTTGANYTWDFSYLTFDSQLRRDYAPATGLPILINFVFGPMASNNYKATYFLPSTDLPIDQLGTFLPITISDVVQYSKKTNDSITSIGLSLQINGNGIPVKSDTIETRYAFPLNYGDNHYSRGYTRLDMNPIYDAIWIQYRQRYTEVDGWGSVSTPYGTFDALRLKHTITETDSLRISFNGNPFWLPIPVPESHIYEWITNGEKDAIMRIVTTLAGGNETVTSIEYKDFNLTASLNELELAFEIYPNPAGDFITISNVSKDDSYYIVDAQGKIVQNGSVNGKIDITSLSNGTFEIVVESNHQIGSKSFIKQD